MVLSYFQQSRPNCKIESDVTTGRQKKIDCFSVDGICYHCNTVLEAMGCYYHYCPCQEARPSLTDTDIERRKKKRQQDEMRKDYIQQKGYQIVEKWECECWSLYKTADASVKSHLRENFPFKRHLSEESRKELSMGDCLVMFNVILKFPNLCEVNCQTFLRCSKKQ